jgi:hypothetical protein
MHLPTVCCAVLCCEEADGVKGAAMYVSPVEHRGLGVSLGKSRVGVVLDL